VVAGDGRSIVRLTITRASLPLFCLVAGALMRPTPRWRRLAGVAAAGVVATVFGAPIGIGQPDVLLLLAGVLLVAPVLVYRGGWAVAGVVGVLQPVTWPVPWTGYQPGTVLVLVLLGAMVGRDALERWPSVRVLELVGRHPLAWYVAHLALLAGAVSIGGL
jgi:hypothetical protein